MAGTLRDSVLRLFVGPNWGTSSPDSRERLRLDTGDRIDFTFDKALRDEIGLPVVGNSPPAKVARWATL